MKINERNSDRIMKLKIFNVVELKNGNRATIIDIKDKNKYVAEIVNAYGITISKRVITDDEINKIIYNQEKQR